MSDASSPPLRHYVSVVRRQAWLVAGVTIIAIGTAALLSLYAQESVYRASMQIVVGQGGGVFQPQYGAQALPFTQTMTNLLDSDIVASTVIDNLQLDETPKRLQRNLKVTTRTESSVLQLSYDSPRGGQAVAILSEIGTVFGRLVDQKLGTGAEGTRPGQEPLAPITVSVFDPAHLEPDAVSPKPRRTILVSGALGFLIGLVLAFARAALDDRIRGRRDAEAWFGAPVVGVLPKGLGKRPYGLANDPSPRRAEVEALHRLRANLQFAQGGIAGPILAVTSAVADEGHTQVAANVGVRLALAGYDVVCVEADLRRPRLGRSLGVSGAVLGLVDVVEGKVALEEALEPVQLGPPRAADTGPLRRILRRTGVGNGARPPAAPQVEDEETVPSLNGSLRVLSVGRVPANPTDVFTAERAAALIDELRSAAQYVVIDTPPLLIFGDSFPLLRLADSVVVVAPDGQVTRDVVVSVRSTLESLGVRRFSVVLTGVNDERDADWYGDLRRTSPSGEIPRSPSQTL